MHRSEGDRTPSPFSSVSSIEIKTDIGGQVYDSFFQAIVGRTLNRAQQNSPGQIHERVGLLPFLGKFCPIMIFPVRGRPPDGLVFPPSLRIKRWCAPGKDTETGASKDNNRPRRLQTLSLS
jgi:hypothetical protein